MFPGFLTPVLTQLSFQSHRLLFSHASAEVRGKNMPKRKFASTEDQTHNHQVMSLTCLPLCHLGGASHASAEVRGKKTWEKNFCLYRVSDSQLPGHESDMLTTEPHGQADPTPGVTSFIWDHIVKTLEFYLYVAMRPRVTKICM